MIDRRILRHKTWMLVALAVTALAAAIAITAVVTRPSGSDTATSRATVRRAVIVDELALTDPNPLFRQAVTTSLEQAGYVVDYAPPRRATVDFFKDLPGDGYDIVVIRSHGSQLDNTVDRSTGLSTTAYAAGIFTGESYTTQTHISDQLNARLSIGSLTGVKTNYFVVGQKFIAASSNGRFRGTKVFLMGCGGRGVPELAGAFLGKGARAVVAWNGSVTANSTDRTFEGLIDDVAGGATMDAAVAGALRDSPKDPVFGSSLLLFE